MVSLYHVNTVHQAELQAQLAKHPNAAIHDDNWYIFVTEYEGDERTSTPIVVDELGLEGDELVWYVAKVLATDKDAVLHMNIRTADGLYRHPAWRIWCAKYEDREQFKSDWLALNELLPSWPEYTESVTYDQAKDLLFNAVV